MENEDSRYLCTKCYGGIVPVARARMQMRSSKPLLCLQCGDAEAKQQAKKFTVLTPHKQGAMYFTQEFAREAAKGINNKGGGYR